MVQAVPGGWQGDHQGPGHALGRHRCDRGVSAITPGKLCVLCVLPERHRNLGHPCSALAPILANIRQKVKGCHLPLGHSSSIFWGRMFKLGFGARLSFLNRFSWIHCRIATTRMMMGSWSQPQVVFHQLPRLSVRWLDANARETTLHRCSCRSRNPPCTDLCVCSAECDNEEDIYHESEPQFWRWQWLKCEPIPALLVTVYIVFACGCVYAG